MEWSRMKWLGKFVRAWVFAFGGHFWRCLRTHRGGLRRPKENKIFAGTKERRFGGEAYRSGVDRWGGGRGVTRDSRAAARDATRWRCGGVDSAVKIRERTHPNAEGSRQERLHVCGRGRCHSAPAPARPTRAHEATAQTRPVATLTADRRDLCQALVT